MGYSTIKFIGSALKHPGFNSKDEEKPAPPDYAGAARAEAAGNLELTRATTKANRIQQYSPYGSLTYTQGGDWDVEGYNQAKLKNPSVRKETFGFDPDSWTSTMNLSPTQQKLLDEQNNISLGLTQPMTKGLGYVNEMLDSPLDTEKFTKMDPASVAGREAVTSAILERMQPGMDRTRQQKENALLIQGHNRGGEAWKASQDDLARAENDMRLAAVKAGGDEQSRLLGLQQAQRQNQLAEAGYLRNEPLNTLNAVRTGAQVTNPTFTNAPQQQNVRGPELLNAATQQYQANLGQYNAGQAANNNMMSGLFQLGSLII